MRMTALLIELNTSLGPLYVRASEIHAVMPELNNPSCAMLYSVIFPNGVSIDESVESVVTKITAANLIETHELIFEPTSTH